MTHSRLVGSWIDNALLCLSVVIVFSIINTYYGQKQKLAYKRNQIFQDSKLSFATGIIDKWCLIHNTPSGCRVHSGSHYLKNTKYSPAAEVSGESTHRKRPAGECRIYTECSWRKLVAKSGRKEEGIFDWEGGCIWRYGMEPVYCEDVPRCTWTLLVPPWNGDVHGHTTPIAFLISAKIQNEQSGGRWFMASRQRWGPHSAMSCAVG